MLIEDEPRAIEVLQRYISKIDMLDLRASIREPLKAIETIHSEQIELLFLDIHLPAMDGVQFYSSLNLKPLVIFTTAYQEHAVQSYDIDAVDYLLKPIGFDRFLKSVSKAQSILSRTRTETSENPHILYVKSGGLTHRVNRDDILYLEKEGNYLTLFLKDKKIVVRENMSRVFDLVPRSDFVRVHKSFVISIRHLETIEAHQVTVGKTKIPLGAFFREAFLKTLTSKGITGSIHL